MTAPIVSVLMTAYNAQRYLEAAVTSVRQQTLRAWELVIVDDGSNDRTPDILRRLARTEDRLIVIRQANAGLAAARNAGLSLCRGRFIAILDSDDVAEPTRLAEQSEYLDQQPALAVGSAAVMMDEKDRLLTTLTPPLSHQAIDGKLLAGHTALFHPSVMIRAEAFQQVGGYRSLYEPAEDLDLFLRIGECGALANIAKPLLRYRLHRRSISERQAARQRHGAYQACHHAWTRRGWTGDFEASSHWRPGGDATSKNAFLCQYGWWAFDAGRMRTAMIYAMKAIRVRPFQREPWVLGVRAGQAICRGVNHESGQHHRADARC
jgi:glycosyltransferase involved in cell wall biosynthesis